MRMNDVNWKHDISHNIRGIICLADIIKVYIVLCIIQLMHSFEVNIRICQPENSDVYRGEAEVNITFEG